MSIGTSLVKLALASHLDTYRHPRDGRTGRQTLSGAMDVPPSGVTDRLNGRAPALLELVREAGRFRIVPDTTLDDLARRVGVDPDPHSWTRRVDVKLWEDLRAANGLRPDDEPTFRAPIDVTLASAALIARYPELTDRSNHRPVKLAPDDLAAAEVLTEALCRITSGPYDARSDAFSSLAVLAPLTLGTISRFLGSSPVGSSVVRVIDRALRLSNPRAAFSQEAQRLIANPPVLLFRNALWMRAVRRVMWIDRQHGRETTKRWPAIQALRGTRGDGAYAWSGAAERRYALWVYAEFSNPDDDAAWDVVRREARTFGPNLVADLEEAREYLATDVRERRRSDFFLFRPAAGWCPPGAIADVLLAHLGPNRVDTARSTRDLGWEELRPSTRRGARALAWEALLAPCTIRQRTAINTMQASTPALRHGVCSISSEILSACVDDHGEIDPGALPVAERCVTLLGSLPVKASVPLVCDLLRRPGLPDSLAKIAVLSAGSLAHAFPDEAPALIAWACDRARKTPSDPLVAAAVHSCVYAGYDPVGQFSPDIAAGGGPGRSAMFDWAARTLRDPLLRHNRS